MERSTCIALLLALCLHFVASQVNGKGVRRVSECLQKGSGSTLSYPPWKQLEQHYADLMDATEKYRQLPVHSKPDYNGLWIENHFIAAFRHRPLAYFGGLVPLFVQWVDYALVLKDEQLRSAVRRERYNFTHNVQYEQSHPLYTHATFRDFYDLLRKDVLYFTVSQDNHGITALSRRFRNILVFSAGGEGHVPLPLIKGHHAYVDLKSVHPKRESVAFFGTVNHGHRKKLLDELQQALQSSSCCRRYNYTAGPSKLWTQGVAETAFNLCPPGYGLGTFRLSEIIQIGRIPVVMYEPGKAWIPYLDSPISVLALGYIAEAGKMQKFVAAVGGATAVEVARRLDAVRSARRHYTYPGVMEQLDKFINDPFGVGNDSYISCYGDLAAKHHSLAVQGPDAHAQMDLLATG